MGGLLVVSGLVVVILLVILTVYFCVDVLVKNSRSPKIGMSKMKAWKLFIAELEDVENAKIQIVHIDGIASLRAIATKHFRLIGLTKYSSLGEGKKPRLLYYHNSPEIIDEDGEIIVAKDKTEVEIADFEYSNDHHILDSIMYMQVKAMIDSHYNDLVALKAL